MIDNLVMFVPSRGRPQNAIDLVAAVRDTSLARTMVLFVIDGDDPSRADYHDAGLDMTVVPAGRDGMVVALNEAVNAHTHGDDTAVGFMGDDHRPRTVGWDAAYLAALNELGSGLVFGNDLVHGAAIPTQIAMTSDIPRALGFMAPGVLRHLYVDNFWRQLGDDLNRIRYLPDVVVEHMHPLVGKADYDEGYRRVNAPDRTEADRVAYEDYLHGSYATDVARVRAVMVPRG